MKKGLLVPSEIGQATIQTGIKKANRTSYKTLLLAIFAGAFISFGAQADITVMQTLGHIDIGFAKFMGAAVFPVGLMLVLMAGGDLFTGNNLMSLAWLDKRISLNQMMKNWSIVYIGNFIGALLLVMAMYYSGLYGSESLAHKAVDIAEAKVIQNTFMTALVKGILCNFIVAITVWLTTGAKDMTGKILAIWFPIMMFVLSGFEHSIANMFFIPMGKVMGANFTWMDMVIRNLIPVTIGNIIGGGVIIPGVYYLIYIKGVKEEATFY